MGTSINSIGQPGSDYVYGALSSGSRINRAADGAAQMAIGKNARQGIAVDEIATAHVDEDAPLLEHAQTALAEVVQRTRTERELTDLRPSTRKKTSTSSQCIRRETTDYRLDPAIRFKNPSSK